MRRTLALFLLIFTTLHAADTKPNLVFILADDLGYGDVGCNNKASKIPTPFLDKLAADGMRFTDAHAPSSLCTPTRYALLTGRYAWRSRLQAGVLIPWGAPLIAPTSFTVADMLKHNGYATACIGKWHLGWDWPTKDGKPARSADNPLSNVDFEKPLGDGPTAHGFDYYFGVDLPNYPPYRFIENDRTVGIPSLPDTGKPDGFNRPGPMLPGWKLVNILPEITKRAVKVVDDSAKAGKPFFLYFALTSPHYPVVPAPEFKGKSQAADYGDFVAQTDWSVGQILEALQRNGVADNTLVIFTSDNGPEITGEVNPGAYDRAKQFDHYSMGDLRGAKRDIWEGGHRVPFIARWPGKIKAGSVSGETICHVDFMATAAAILNTKVPEDAAPDSYNLLPVLTSQPYTSPLREATVHHAGSGKFAIRKANWVLLDAPNVEDNNKSGEPAWFKEKRGYANQNEPRPQGSVPGELHDLSRDLSERENLYAQYPDVVKELKSLLEKYVADGRSTPGAPQKNDVPIKIHKGAPQAK